MADTTTNNAPTASSTHSLSEKEKLRQSQRLQDNLVFLRRIDKVVVTGTHDEDRVTFLDLTVLMADSSTTANTSIVSTSKSIASTSKSIASTSKSIVSKASSAPTEKELEKERKKLRPSVDFQTAKSIKTLMNVHDAIYEWSLKPHRQRHLPDAATSDDNNIAIPAPPPTPLPCAYCSQFSSPAALDLWARMNPQHVVWSDTGLVVVVNNNELLQYEKCINDYLRSARAVPSKCLDDYDECCEGVAHIPSIVANFLQRLIIKTKWYSAAACGVGM